MEREKGFEGFMFVILLGKGYKSSFPRRVQAMGKVTAHSMTADAISLVTKKRKKNILDVDCLNVIFFLLVDI